MTRVTIPDVSGMTSKQAAHAYLESGDGLLMPWPWVPREKAGKATKVPMGIAGRHYHELSVTHDDIEAWRDHWRCGLITSRASGLLVLDLDRPAEFLAWRLGRGMTLPDTAWASTGRAGGGIHAAFDARELSEEEWPLQSAIWPGLDLGEVKSNGFIAAEPSLHPSGAPYRWQARDTYPVLGAEAAGLRQLLRDRQAERAGLGSTAALGDGEPLSEADGWIAHGIAEMGSGQQRAAFLKIVLVLARRGMKDEEIISACAAVAAISPSDPRRPWLRKDFAGMLPGARSMISRRDKEEAAEASEGEDDLLSVTKGNRGGKAPAVVPGPAEPMGVAREFVKLSLARGVSTLVSWRGDFYKWDGAQWNDADAKIIRDELYHWLERCKHWKSQATKTQPKAKPVLEPWSPNVILVNRVLDALASVVALPWDAEPGMWLDLSGSRFKIPGKPSFEVENGHDVRAAYANFLLSVPTLRVIALSSGLLDVKNRVINKPSPTFFNLSSIEFLHARSIEGSSRTLEYACPDWIRFLQSLWPDDKDSIRLLRQWFGYVLSGDTSRQKIMLLVGPKRSGKGTIARVLRALMTARNVANPTAESLKDRFGLRSLIGKSLAVVGDARFEGFGIQTVIERLLSISGEDAIDVDRKNKPIWNGRLGTRFMILTNKVPELGDASGAIASRFLVLEMMHSWIGQEELGLEEKLMAELPGILFWALDGMYELEEEKAFVVPESAAEAHETMEELSSPHAAFIDEMCEIGNGLEIPCAQLYECWKRWCEANGRKYPDSSARFGRDLRAAVPGITGHNRGADGERTRTYDGIALKPEVAEEDGKAEEEKTIFDSMRLKEAGQ